TVTITLDYTRPSTDHDPAFILTDGTNSLTISMADNDGGSVSGNGTLLTGTIPTVAGSSTIVLTYSFTTGGNALGAMEGLLSKTLAGTTGLDAATGLTFRMRGGNGGEIYQIDGIAVSYSVASGSSDLGAYEVDPVATTLTLDEMIVPENLIGGQAFEVHSHATSTGAGPLVYSWEVTDEGGNLLTSGTGDTTNLTTSLTAENPVQNVTVTLTVTDTTTGQSVTQTQKTVLTQADATGATGTAGSVVVTTVDDVVESTTDRLSFDNGTTSFVVGETVTGGTSGATAEVVAILNVTGTSGGGDEAGTLVLRTLSGTFADDEAITSASGAALANGANFTDVDHLVSLREAINLANASGAGSFVITFDPSLDTTNIISSLNPNVISLNYDTETANFAVGETVTSSTGGSALIIAVIDNGASGTLSLINVTGTFNDNNALSVGGTQRALANGGLYNDDLNRGGDFDITKSNGTVYIVGNGMTNTIIDGGAVDRVFDIKARAEVVFEDLKITGGVTTTATLSDHGAGFRNTGGTVILHDVDITGNDSTRTSDNVGGGFYSTRSGTLAGRVLMTGGFIRNNFADSHGGGFYVDDPNMAEALIYLNGTVISGNTASNASDRTDRDGGGFYITGSRNRLDAVNVVIENNTTKDDGGGFYWANRYGKATFDNVIIR
ncbi:MAG: hypothetical protein KDM64_13525, partial [Verrucomicrobiae bacterium]|nr:hypothetical protein [Verrucomicrobiae bacterium]